MGILLAVLLSLAVGSTAQPQPDAPTIDRPMKIGYDHP